jgi:hypothetical protein
MDIASFAASLLAAIAVVLVPYLLYRVARWARAQSKGAYVLGIVLAPFGAVGNVADPDFRIVNAAQQNKKREEDDAGDPPSDEHEEGAQQSRGPTARPPISLDDGQ